jgi:hypothetical protein
MIDPKAEALFKKPTPLMNAYQIEQLAQRTYADCGGASKPRFLALFCPAFQPLLASGPLRFSLRPLLRVACALFLLARMILQNSGA